MYNIRYTRLIRLGVSTFTSIIILLKLTYTLITLINIFDKDYSTRRYFVGKLFSFLSENLIEFTKVIANFRLIKEVRLIVAIKHIRIAALR